MISKIHLISIVTLLLCKGHESKPALRKTPKVYNALITTDENLTASRAYPVIQPTIHETGLSYYPFGPYNPYGFYPHIARFGQPIVPGLLPREQLRYPLPPSQYPFPPMLIAGSGKDDEAAAAEQAFAVLKQPQIDGKPFADPQSLPVPGDQQQPVLPPAESPARADTVKYMPVDDGIKKQQQQLQMPNERLPIVLNDFGLPPALVPLQRFPSSHQNTDQQTAHHLPPYPYPQYPVLPPAFYDPITGYREQFLPPFKYAPVSPPYTGSNNNNNNASDSVSSSKETANEVAEETSENADDAINSETTEASNFEDIKNASKLKNSEVPDVSPPPIPSGAKASE